MQVIAVIATKGGVGKTTIAANLGGFVADAGLRVLLVDLDVQPTLSSYYALSSRAPSGVYELLACNEHDIVRVSSRTSVANLDVIVSNDAQGQLNTLLLHAPDGRLRLRNLLPFFASHYDLVILDTQGARSVLLEAAVLAANLAVSPITPEVLAARELHRGTIRLLEDLAPYRHLGVQPPPLALGINRAHPVSANARLVQQALRQVFSDDKRVRVLNTAVPAIETYPRAASLGLPAHRIEHRRPSGRIAPSALETMRALATELFPQWDSQFAGVTGRRHVDSA